jgi:hypothetical protein
MGQPFQHPVRVGLTPKRTGIYENEWRTHVLVRNGIVLDAQKRALWLVGSETYTLFRALEIGELKRHGLKWLGGVRIPGDGLERELVVAAPLEEVDAGSDLARFDIFARQP